MKIAAAYISNSSQANTNMNIMVWPDSAMIRSGKPLFLPDDEEWRYIMIGIAVKIDSVGKSIQQKYAERYYKELAPMAFVMTRTAAEKIRKHQDPLACEIVADYSLICGDFITAEGKWSTLKTELNINKLPTAAKEIEEINNKFEINGVQTVLAEAIFTASQNNTLKTGDIVAFIIPQSFNAYPETILRVKLADRTLIETKLK